MPTPEQLFILKSHPEMTARALGVAAGLPTMTAWRWRNAVDEISSDGHIVVVTKVAGNVATDNQGAR